MHFLSSRWIKVPAIHELPEMFDAERIFTNQQSCALLDRIFGAAFANAGNPLIGFDRYDVKTLVEDGSRIRIVIEANPSNFHFGRRSLDLSVEAQGCARSQKRRLEERSSLHLRLKHHRFETLGSEMSQGLSWE